MLSRIALRPTYRFSTRHLMSGPLPSQFAVTPKIAEELSKGDVWSIFSPLSGLVPADSVNLGQGYMSWLPPAFLRDAAHKALEEHGPNHYTLPRGVFKLRQQISDVYSGSFGRTLDPNTEVIVTAGANEGTFAFAQAYLNPGDEVILFEPYFDQYLSQVKFTGAKPVFIPIHPPADASSRNVEASEWTFDWGEVRAAITPRTKMIWINTPHNPIGKVMTADELRIVGGIAKEHNLMILADEVYDCLSYESEHIRIASLDDFWERTVTVGSAGKSFSATGWRIGWVVGPKDLIQGTLAATTRIVFCNNGVAQTAAGDALELTKTNGFFAQQAKEYTERRKVLLEGLEAAGLPYTFPNGSYFVLVNIKNLEIPTEFEFPDFIKNRSNDYKASWFVAQTAGVVTIPPTDFYGPENFVIGQDYIRFAFCKDIDTIQEAMKRLQKLKPYIKK